MSDNNLDLKEKKTEFFSQELQISVILSIYQYLFFNWDFDKYLTEYNPVDNLKIYFCEDKSKDVRKISFPDSEKLKEIIKFFDSNKTILFSFLEKYTNDWDKTYKIVQAIFLSYTLEIINLDIKAIENIDNTKPKISEQVQLTKPLLLRKYLKISKNLGGGDIITTIFAVLSKITSSFNLKT